jgi:hypothetical protein
MQYNNWRRGMERQESDEDLKLASRCWNLELALGDVKNNEKAEGYFERAITRYERALKDDNKDFKESERIADTARAMLLFRGEENRYLMHSHYGWASILCVVKEEHMRVFELLLRTGQVDINVRDRHDNTPLVKATEQGSLEVVELLLQEKAEVNAVAAAWDGGKERHCRRRKKEATSRLLSGLGKRGHKTILLHCHRTRHFVSYFLSLYLYS